MCKKLIVCAGMHRSGSTWLYNAVRLIIASQGLPVYGCFSSNYRQDDGRPVHVVKTHAFSPGLKGLADCIFTTRRDLRDVAASAVRMQLCRHDPSHVVEYLIRIVEQDYVPWMQFSDFELPYEEMVRDETHFIEVLGLFLGATVSGEDIRGRIEALGPGAESLLHEGHITRREPGTFAEVLPPETIHAVEKAFRGWQAQRGYSQTPDPRQTPCG